VVVVGVVLELDALLVGVVVAVVEGVGGAAQSGTSTG
jgi:hypothetical protein